MFSLLTEPAQWLWMGIFAFVAAILTVLCVRWTARNPRGGPVIVCGIAPALLVFAYFVWFEVPVADLINALTFESIVGWLMFVVSGLIGALGAAHGLARRLHAQATMKAFE
jgi:hypothetical protein